MADADLMSIRLLRSVVRVGVGGGGGVRVYGGREVLQFFSFSFFLEPVNPRCNPCGFYAV